MWTNIPNLLTISRILLVPLTVWSLIHGDYGIACLTFIVAGITDGLDGYLARKLNLQTELGAYLDALADKSLLVAVYVTLAILQLIPGWLAIIVVTRDLLIVGAVLLSRFLEQPVEIRPVFISKANTVAQIGLAAGVLLSLAINVQHETTLLAASAVVAFLTFWSFAVYMQVWLTHMTTDDTERKP
jgi:cardiolipin synthase (CMP-forming)